VTAKKPDFFNSNISMVLLFVVTLITFWNTLNNGFTNFDDDVIILNNPLVKDFSFAQFPKLFTSFTNGMYHPITTFSLAMDNVLFGLNAKGFHAVSLLIHLVNILLAFKLAGLLSRNVRISFIVALLFAIHPMHSESVYWLSERKGLLCALFMLSGMICYVKFLSLKVKKYYLISFLFFVLAVLSKPSAIAFPLIMVVFDYFFNNDKSGIKKINFANKVPFVLVSIAIAVVALKAANSVEGIVTFPHYNLFDRLVLPMYALMLYIVKALLPIDLSAKYFFPEKQGNFLPVEYMVMALAFIVLVFILFKYVRKNKEIIFGLLFFLAAISVFLPLVSVGDSVICERHSYISYFGLFYIAGICCEKLYQKGRRMLILIVVSALGIVFMIFSFQRYRVWSDSIALWKNIVKMNPSSALAYVNLGRFSG